MILASDQAHTRAQPIELLHKQGPFITWIAAYLGATRASLRRVEDAHASRCTLASLAEEIFHDTGIDPSDATGIASCQPDLPFFMQSGFGKR